MDRFNLDPRSCGKIQSYSRASMISIRSPFKRIEIRGSHRASWQGSGPCPRWPSNRGGRYSSLTASNVTGHRVCLPSNSSGFARCGFDDSSRNQSTLDSITYFSLKFFLKGRAVWKGTAVSMWHTYIFWNFVAFFRNVKKSSWFRPLFFLLSYNLRDCKISNLDQSRMKISFSFLFFRIIKRSGMDRWDGSIPYFDTVRNIRQTRDRAFVRPIRTERHSTTFKSPWRIFLFILALNFVD